MSAALQLASTFEGQPLSTIQYKGQPVWPAYQVGAVLGYSAGGSRFTKRISGAWSDEFVEGQDFVRVEGEDLAALKVALSLGPDSGPSRSPLPAEVAGSRLAPDSGSSQGSLPTDPVGSRARHLLLLTEAGMYLACLLTRKPAGRRLRRWLASEILPALARGESVGVVPSSPRSVHPDVETRLAKLEAVLLTRSAAALPPARPRTKAEVARLVGRRAEDNELRALLAGRSDVTSAEAARLLGMPDSLGARISAGRRMSRLGWRRRKTPADGRFFARPN